MPTAQINGFEMHYEDVGDGAPIVLQHGFMGCHDEWDAVVEHLRASYRLVLPDLRGAGDSAAPSEGYSVRQYAKDIVALADHLGLGEFAYTGWSLGGLIGYQLGLNHADRLSRLILVASAPADMAGMQEAMAAADPTAPAIMDSIAVMVTAILEGDRDRVAAAARVGYIRAIPESVFEHTVDRLMTTAPQHLGLFEDLSNAELDNLERLGEMSIPSLVMVGAEDSLAPANLADYAKLPNATLHVFSGAGHSFPQELPAETATVIGDFVEHGVRAVPELPEELRVTA